MRERGLPELMPGALRDHATSERVDRVWRRLESDLSVTTPKHRAALWWAPAALVIVFGGGVFVGAHWRGEEPVAGAVAVVAEPQGSLEPAGRPETVVRLLPEPLPAEPAAKSERRSAAPQIEPEQAAEPVVAPPAVLSVLPAAPVVAGPPEWQLLANNGDYAGARVAVERHGGFDAAFAAATPDQLMMLYDVARASGQRTRAVQALRLVFERHPGDPNAAIAAFTLGNLLESAGDKAGAAAAFEIHRRLSPKGDLADSALAREFDLAVDSGDLERARQLADQYAKDYPKGRRLGAMRKRLAELSGAPPVAEGVEGDESEDETDEVVSPSGP